MEKERTARKVDNKSESVSANDIFDQNRYRHSVEENALL